MTPTPPPAIDRSAVTKALANVEWSKLRVQLLRFALSRCKSREEADDLVQGALVKVMSHGSSWNPATHSDLARWLIGSIAFDLRSQRTTARARRDVPLSRARVGGARESDDDGTREGDHLRDANAFSEDAAARVDLFARRMRALRERLRGDALALEVLELTVNGVDTPAERCAATGRPHEAVESARRRMQHHAAIVARELSGEESVVEDEGRDEDDDETEVA